MASVGIIGFGSFGEFVAKQLDPHVEVRVFSRTHTETQWSTTLEAVAACDFVVPCIPLDAYESMLTTLRPLLRQDTVIVDVCSVKEKPLEIIKNILPDQPLVATHPLFGPESAKHSLSGHTLVVCQESSDSNACERIVQFAEEIGLHVVRMTAKEHDEQMAVVHGLTFFIARSLRNMKIHDYALTTPSFHRLLHLADLEKHHSDDLFQTIQAGNAYSKAVRKQFINTIEQLDQEIDHHGN